MSTTYTPAVCVYTKPNGTFIFIVRDLDIFILEYGIDSLHNEVRFFIKFPVPAQNLMHASFPVLRGFATNETTSVSYPGSENMESIRSFIETKLGIVPIKVGSYFVYSLLFME